MIVGSSEDDEDDESDESDDDDGDGELDFRQKPETHMVKATNDHLKSTVKKTASSLNRAKIAF